MERLLVVTTIGFLCGILGTGTGGLFTFLLKNPTRRFMATLLGFTSGIMIAVVCFDLLPEAFKVGGMGLSLLGIAAGVAAIIIIDELLPKRNIIKKTGDGFDFIRSGILLGIGIAIHNFPEGLAVGSGFAANDLLGLGLTLVIGLHDIPEGIAMAAPLKMGGFNKYKMLLYTVLAGVPMGLGAMIGELLGELSQVFICICLAFAGGAMLYITCGELIPKTQNIYKGRISTIGMIAGIMCGIYISGIF